MNQTFSFSRFRLMLRWELATKGQSYLLMAAPLLVFMLLLMLILAFGTKYNTSLSGLHYAALVLPVLVGGSLYTNQAFSQYSSRDTGMAALMVPASRFEKVLSALVMNLVFMIPLLLLFLFLQDWAINIANSRLPADVQPFQKISVEDLQTTLVFFILFQGLLFFGSLYFTNYSFVKTFAVFMIMILVIMQANLWFAEYLIGGIGGDYRLTAFPFTSWQITLPNTSDYDQIQHVPLIQNLTYLLPLLLLLALWYISYVRLGEKEI